MLWSSLWRHRVLLLLPAKVFGTKEMQGGHQVFSSDVRRIKTPESAASALWLNMPLETHTHRSSCNQVTAGLASPKSPQPPAGSSPSSVCMRPANSSVCFEIVATPKLKGAYQLTGAAHSRAPRLSPSRVVEVRVDAQKVASPVEQHAHNQLSAAEQALPAAGG